MSEVNTERANRVRALADIRNDVAARIRPVCVGWAEDDVCALIEHIVEVQYKYDYARIDIWFPSDNRD
jgi:hypothetical protein